MKKLIVRNFGPVKSADIEVKKYNCFIGETSSGKSTIAKLLAVFYDFMDIKNENDVKKENIHELFKKRLDDYKINFLFEDNTYIKFEDNKYYCVEIRGKENLNFKYLNQTDNEETKKEENKEPDKTLNLEKKVNSVLNLLRKQFDIPKYDLSSSSKETINLEKNQQIFFQFAKSIISIISTTYIPAERIFISMLSNSLFSLLNSSVNLPSFILKFGDNYQRAKTFYKNLDINFMDLKVEFSEDKEKIYYKKKLLNIGLDETSSGFQSLIPLMAVLQYTLEKKASSLIVIEEPELNLFPTSQVSLINTLIQKLTGKENDIILTTHSPYILSAIDNSIYANEVLKKYRSGDKYTEIEARVKKITKQDHHIDFKDVSSYFFSKNGVVKRITNKNRRNIGADKIDEASNITASVYNELSNLYYNE